MVFRKKKVIIEVFFVIKKNAMHQAHLQGISKICFHLHLYPTFPLGGVVARPWDSHMPKLKRGAALVCGGKKSGVWWDLF